MLREAFGDHSLSPTAVFECDSHFMVCWVSVEDDEHTGRWNSRKMTENVEEFENSSTKTVVEQSVSLQTPLVSVMEFARRS
jgi:hypothetical protein